MPVVPTTNTAVKATTPALRTGCHGTVQNRRPVRGRFMDPMIASHGRQNNETRKMPSEP